MLIALLPAAAAQDELSEKPLLFGVQPLQNPDMDLIQQQSEQGAGLKVWQYEVTSTRKGSSGKTYKGVMVGSDPFTTNGTTTTTVYVVPLIVQIGSETFDPTVADSSCLGGEVPVNVLKNSPMVQATHDFKMNGVDIGKAQYSDAFQRANFWAPVFSLGETYHHKLKYKFLPAVTIAPDPSHSHLYPTSGLCIAQYGGIQKSFLDLLVQLIIPGLWPLGVSPSNLPVFMLYNTLMYGKTVNDCCIGGYHGAVGSPVQTYSPFDFDSTGKFGTPNQDVAIMSHEINEWQDDPLGNNPTPAWGHVGQVTGCQKNLEVGDPLSGTDYGVVKMNGFNYHLQELAFFNWFYGGPSMGAGGLYSDNGTFTAAQGACK
jgi:hypothetical protein